MSGKPEPRMIVINGFCDLIPETFTGDNAEKDVKEFFLTNSFNGNNCMLKGFIMMLLK